MVRRPPVGEPGRDPRGDPRGDPPRLNPANFDDPPGGVAGVDTVDCVGDVSTEAGGGERTEVLVRLRTCEEGERQTGEMGESGARAAGESGRCWVSVLITSSWLLAATPLKADASVSTTGKGEATAGTAASGAEVGDGEGEMEESVGGVSVVEGGEEEAKESVRGDFFGAEGDVGWEKSKESKLTGGSEVSPKAAERPAKGSS